MNEKEIAELKDGSMNKSGENTMSSNIRFSETGSSPYYLNTDTTIKEVSNQDNTDPKNGLLEASLKNRIVIDSSIIKSPTIMNNNEDENRRKDEKLENIEAEVVECLILLKNLHDLCDWNGISSTWMDDAAKIIGLEGVE